VVAAAEQARQHVQSTLGPDAESCERGAGQAWPQGAARQRWRLLLLLGRWGSGLRYRQGETITTSFVELTINQVVSRRFVKKQQMAWTLRGARLLLQTRTKVLNNELEEVFCRWYPRFRTEARLTPDFLLDSIYVVRI